MKEPAIFRKLLGWAGFLFVCALGLAGGTFAGYVRRSPFLNSLVKHTFNPQPPEKVFNKESMTVLVLGCDEDVTTGGAKVTKQQARSDMMMVARCDFANQRISAISVPRDTYYKFPEDKNGHKLNAFHAYGGNELAKKAVQNLLGITIDRVVTLDFVAFQDLVNLVGGVDLVVDKQLDYDDNAGHLHIHLKPGRQHMDGYKAMGFVRFRHSDSDLARQMRQHQFLMALKDQVMRNPQALEQVAEMGQRVLGNEFSNDETISLAMFGRSIPKDSLKMAQTPVTYKKHSAFLYLNRKATHKLLVEMGMKPSRTVDLENTVAVRPRHRRRTSRNEE